MSKVSAVLFALLCLSGCGWNPFGSKAEYLRRGRDFAAQGKFDDAAFQFRKALQKDPNYGEAYLRYGQLLAMRNRTSEAFYPLSRAVDLIPASQQSLLKEAQIALGRIAVSALLGDPRRPQQFYQTAGRMATAILVSDPKSFEGLRLKGYLAVVDSKPEDAIRYFRETLAVNPKMPEIVTVLTQTLFSDNQDAAAETTARNGLAAFETYGPLYDTLYGYYVAHDRQSEAEQLLRAKIANNPRQAFFVIQLADHLWGRKETQQAGDLLQAFVANSADYPTAPLDAGDFYRRTGNPEEAIRLYEKGLNSSHQRKPDKTKDYLQRIFALRLSQGHQQEAFDAVEALLKQFPDDVEALEARADLRMASGKPEEMQKAVVELADLVRKEPARNEIRDSLAQAYRRLGRTQEAQSTFQEVLQRDSKNRDALRELADMSIRDRKPDEALVYAERLIAVDPKNTGARLVRTAAWALHGRFPEVRAELHRLTTENSDLTEAWLQTGELDLETKDYAEAEQIFLRINQAGKGDARAVKGLVLLYLAQAQPQKALAFARQAATRSGNPQVQIVLATTAAQTGDTDLALTTARNLSVDFPENPDYLTFIGEMYQKEGKLDQAITTFQMAQSKAPGNPVPGSFLADALAQSGRFDEAIEASRKNLNIRPGDSLLVNALAWNLALAGKNLDEAAKLTQQVLLKEPANASFLDTQGMIFLKSGKLDDALRTFRQLVLKQGEVPAFRTHLAAVLIQQGDRGKARAELETALRNHPSPSEEREIRELLKTAS